jgi:hypothetical protein
MYTRLYFLFPSITHAQKVVDELQELRITQEHIHAIAKPDVDLRQLPRATKRQRKGMAHKIEYWLWQLNLAVFAAALTVSAISLFNQQFQLALAMLFVMMVTFVAGYLWAQVPDMPVKNFHQEMSHGEILLMVDVMGYRVHGIEQHVHRHHPEAISAGTSWMIDAFDL